MFKQALSRSLIGVIVVYQRLLSPALGANCRYLPTCSAYAREALERHGIRKGVWMALRRVGRCHPWGGSGHDPVPECDSDESGSSGAQAAD